MPRARQFRIRHAAAGPAQAAGELVSGAGGDHSRDAARRRLTSRSPQSFANWPLVAKGECNPGTPFLPGSGGCIRDQVLFELANAVGLLIMVGFMVELNLIGFEHIVSIQRPKSLRSGDVPDGFGTFFRAVNAIKR
jgi:hypothetical protein